MGVYETYYRNLRFRLFGGQVLEASCAGAIEDDIKLRSVKTLPSLIKTKHGKKTKHANPGNPDDTDWLTPVVYRGASEEPSAMNKSASGVRTVQDMFLAYAGHVKSMFW